MPIGIGSGYVESLSSYLMRLAESHSVRLGDLLRCVILPQMSYLNIKNRRPHALLSKMPILNKCSEVTRELVSILQSQTLTQELSCTTLIPISNFFNVNNVLKDNRSWCPQCLHEAKTMKTAIYEPLIWNLSFMSTCTVHGSPLEDVCPRCGRTQYVLTFSSRPGYCSHCHTWLGHDDVKAARYPREPKNNKSIIDFLARIQTMEPDVNRRILNKNLSWLLAKVIADSPKVFNNKTLFNLQRWCTTSTKPNLVLFVDLCNRHNISVSDMMTIDIEASLGAHQNNSIESLHELEGDHMLAFMNEAAASIDRLV